MYIVLTYDVGEKRVQKVCTYLRRYLHWVQNSVFEGEITEGQYAEMTQGLQKIIKPDQDSIYIFHWPAERLMRKTILGQARGKTDWLIE